MCARADSVAMKIIITAMGLAIGLPAPPPPRRIPEPLSPLLCSDVALAIELMRTAIGIAPGTRPPAPIAPSAPDILPAADERNPHGGPPPDTRCLHALPVQMNGPSRLPFW